MRRSEATLSSEGVAGCCGLSGSKRRLPWPASDGGEQKQAESLPSSTETTFQNNCKVLGATLVASVACNLNLCPEHGWQGPSLPVPGFIVVRAVWLKVMPSRQEWLPDG